MGTTKGKKSREKILEMAITLIYDKGFADTSAQEIADLVGVSQANIFYHFKNKKKLFLEALNYVIQNNRNIFARMLSEQTYDRTHLKTLLLANIQWALNYPEQTNIVLTLFNFATFDKDFKELAEQTMLGGRRQLLDILSKMETPQNIDKEELAVMIQQFANGAMFQLLASSHPMILAKRFEKSLDYYLDSIL